MWKELSFEWQTVLSEAWEAFCAGSTPIGAALYNKEGELILSDRNRSRESDTVNTEISHAEANALRRLDTRKFNSWELTLYTSMEPCPMCMGMALMGHIKNIRYAAYDKYCGMIHLTNDDPYYKSKNVNCIHEGGELELFQLTIQSYYELRHLERGCSDKVINKFRLTRKDAVELSEHLYKDKTLDILAESGKSCEKVFDMIVRMNRDEAR